MSKEKKEFINSLIVPLAILVLLWAIKFFETISGISLSQYGLHPHSLEKGYGILTMHVLHSDYSHLASNSLALFVLLSGLYLFYKKFATQIFIQFYIFTGLATWIIASEGQVHIGASGIVYALAWFHILSGFIRRNKPQAAFGFLVVFLYGSVVWGIFPMFQSKENISWQGHLAGAITGSVLAIYYRNKGLPLSIDKEEDEDEDYFDNYLDEDDQDFESSEEKPYWHNNPYRD